MSFKLHLDEPATVYIKDVGKCDLINVFLDGLDKPYFFRVLNSKYPAIKFNLCHAGDYTSDFGTVVKVMPIEIIPLKYQLPKPDRQREKWFEFRHNPELTGSPARNFTQTGIIEMGVKFSLYPYPVRLFILLHELGHFKYYEETNADAYAATIFIKMGYNHSTAYYSLSNVLNYESPRNKQRIDNLFSHLQN